jgi:hypothetical protein
MVVIIFYYDILFLLYLEIYSVAKRLKYFIYFILIAVLHIPCLALQTYSPPLSLTLCPKKLILVSALTEFPCSLAFTWLNHWKILAVVF